MIDLDFLSHKISIHSKHSKERFHIFNSSDTGTKIHRNIQQYQIGGRTVPVVFCFKSIQIFWNNHQKGFLSVTQHLLKIFRCKISISIGYYDNDSLQPITSELLNLQVELKNLTFYLNESQDQTLWNQISSNFGLVEYLRIVSDNNPGFTPVFTSWPQKISIFTSAWFTLEYLLACTSTRITLGCSHLGNKDLEETLKKWKTGGFPNLEYLCVYSQGITNNGTTIMGMNPSELHGKDVQADDGSKKTTFDIDYGRLEMFVTPVA